MNQQETQQVKNDYKSYTPIQQEQTIQTNNDKIDFNLNSKNEYLNINNNSNTNTINNDYKYTSVLNRNDLKIKKDYLINNNYNTIGPKTNVDKYKNIKLQVETEEKKFKKIEEEKNQLIKEERESRQIFYNEFTKRQNNLNTNYLIQNYENFEKDKKMNYINNTNNTDNININKKSKNNLEGLLIENKIEETPIKPLNNTQDQNINTIQK